MDPQHLEENGGEKICILALDEAGRVSCLLNAVVYFQRPVY